MKVTCSDESGNHLMEHQIPQGEESPNAAKLAVNSKGPIAVSWEYSDTASLPNANIDPVVAAHVRMAFSV